MNNLRTSLRKAIDPKLTVNGDSRPPGGQPMDDARAIVTLTVMLVALMLLVPPCRAQEASSGAQGIDSGNYHIQQTVEASGCSTLRLAERSTPT